MSEPIEFRPIGLNDKEWVVQLLRLSDYNTTDYNFTVMYIWRHIIHTNVARYKDMLLVRFADSTPDGSVHKLKDYDTSGESNEPRTPKGDDNVKRFNYLFPAGRETESGDLERTVQIVFEDAAKNSAKVAFVCSLPQHVEWLKAHSSSLNGQFSIFEMRDSFDYIYDAEQLKTLKGKKFQSKRNFVNGFKRSFNWSFEPMSLENLQECRQMCTKWYEINKQIESPTFWSEKLSVEQAFDNFTALGCIGGVLKVDGNVVGFTIGEKLNSNTLLVHIEKALYNYRGAYQTLGNEFLNYASGIQSFEYVNREDDAGDSGLRCAKMEYHPICLAEKFYIKFD